MQGGCLTGLQLAVDLFSSVALLRKRKLACPGRDAGLGSRQPQARRGKTLKKP